MDASFEKPTQKNWKKKYIQLDFSYSIKELESICKCDACRPAWQAFDKAVKKAETKARKESIACTIAYKKAAKKANKKRVTKQ
jgi:hypothetical protein